MCEVELNTRVYVKMVLHAAHYPHSTVSGVLLGHHTPSCLTLVDCVPVCHLQLPLSLSLEVALAQVPYCFLGVVCDTKTCTGLLMICTLFTNSLQVLFFLSTAPSSFPLYHPHTQLFVCPTDRLMECSSRTGYCWFLSSKRWP